MICHIFCEVTVDLIDQFFQHNISDFHITFSELEAEGIIEMLLLRLGE